MRRTGSTAASGNNILDGGDLLPLPGQAGVVELGLLFFMVALVLGAWSFQCGFKPWAGGPGHPDRIVQETKLSDVCWATARVVLKSPCVLDASKDDNSVFAAFDQVGPSFIPSLLRWNRVRAWFVRHLTDVSKRHRINFQRAQKPLKVLTWEKGHYFKRGRDGDGWRFADVDGANVGVPPVCGFKRCAWTERYPRAVLNCQRDCGRFSGTSSGISRNLSRVSALFNEIQRHNRGESTNNDKGHTNGFDQKSPIVYSSLILVVSGAFFVSGFVGIYRGLRNVNVNQCLVGILLTALGAAFLLKWVLWMATSYR